MTDDGTTVHMTLGEHCLETNSYQRLEKLEEHKRTLGITPLILGSEIQTGSQFYLIASYQQRSWFGVEIVTDGQMLPPHVLLLPSTGNVMLGYNREITTLHWMNPENLGTIYFPQSHLKQFIHLAKHGYVLALFESGIVALSEQGTEFWRREFDVTVVSGRLINPEIIELSFDNDSNRFIWIYSGDDIG